MARTLAKLDAALAEVAAEQDAHSKADRSDILAWYDEWLRLRRRHDKLWNERRKLNAERTAPGDWETT